MPFQMSQLRLQTMRDWPLDDADDEIPIKTAQHPHARFSVRRGDWRLSSKVTTTNPDAISWLDPAIEPVVYVVDDDASVREALGNLLRSVGLKVQLFASAIEFRQHRPAQGPSCLVLDVRLPIMSGLDLQNDLRALGDRTPIIFITGHGDVPMSVRAMKAGAIEFLQKPFREQDLLDAINSGLSQSIAAASAAPERVAENATVPAASRAEFDAINPRWALARNIQMGRTIFGWSQEELGNQCGLHRSHISALEREELSVGVDAIDHIASAFGIAPHVLLMPPADAQSSLLKASNITGAKPQRVRRGSK
jgi:FixJ family two-component response regulator/DNA-binding XRE family transcriptional regulator